MNELKKYIISKIFSDLSKMNSTIYRIPRPKTGTTLYKALAKEIKDFYPGEYNVAMSEDITLYLKPSLYKNGIPDSISSLSFAIGIFERRNSMVFFDVHTMEIIARN